MNRFNSRKLNFLLIGIIIGLTAGILTGFFGTGRQTVEAGNTDLKDMQYTFNTVAETVLPVVVELRVVEVLTQEIPEGYNWPFNFIEPELDDNSSPDIHEYESEGLGSGIIVRKSGNTYFVLTNGHVIGDADRITIRLYSGSEHEGSIVGTDERKDLALVSFESSEDLPVAVLGDSEKIDIGDWVLAIGSPLGYDFSVTAGIVSAVGRNGPANNISDFIQTDASINQGNSGGALVNLDGEVVGINTWIATNSGESIGLGFSIPVNNVRNAIDDFITEGSVQYGWLGITIAQPDEITAEDLGLTGKNGAIVYNVYETSPAGLGGIKPGDFITGLNGVDIMDYMQLTRLIGDIRAGDTAEIELIRSGKTIVLKAEIELRKSREELSGLHDTIWPGFTAIPLSEETSSDYNLGVRHGAIISVEAGTRAFRAGLRDYDIITSINGEEIDNMLDFYAVLNDKNNNYSFNVVRNDQEIEILLKRQE